MTMRRMVFMIIWMVWMMRALLMKMSTQDNLVKEKDGEGGVDPEEGGGVGRGRLLSHLI